MKKNKKVDKRKGDFVYIKAAKIGKQYYQRDRKINIPFKIA